MKNQNNHSARLKATMENVAASVKLPEFYKTDLELDFETLEKFSGTKLVWLLRSCGTVLVPARLGVDPCYVTHWLWGNHGQEIVPFIVDTKTGLIEKTTFEKAERLICEPPCKLSSTMSQDQLHNEVNRVLERGCELRIWGIFESPNSISAIGNWSSWQSYFSTTGNRPMADFMGKAIRLMRTKNSSKKLEGSLS
jgi:hypothetical protein